MRESKFIDRNSEKWKRFEEGIQAQNLGPDELERAFLELNDDLAYSRTYYPNRSVRVFLNNLLTPVYDKIYKSRPFNRKAMVQFFTQTAPRIHFSARQYMLVSFMTVLLGFLVGFFGTRHDAQFAHTVLGSSYVNMTENNIEKGDPLGVYKHDSAGEMFLGIATNNLRVGFYFFVFGALFCVGTLYLLLTNGIVLGVFTYMFTSRGLTGEYVLTVYQHGTLEILSMVVEGAAGIMLGSGLLFPGTLTRTQAIQNAARKSITMFLVCIPIIIVAAFIESYLTRFTNIGNVQRTLIILLSLGFMLYYFLILPWLKHRRNKQFDVQEEQPRPETVLEFIPETLHSIGGVLMMTVYRLRKSMALWGLLSLGLGIAGFYLANHLGNQDITRDVAFQLRRWVYSSTQANPDSIFEAVTSGAKLILWNIYACRYVFSAARFPELLPVLLLMWFMVFAVLQLQASAWAGKTVKFSAWLKTALYATAAAAILWLVQGFWWPVLWLLWPLLSMGLGLGILHYQGNLFRGFRASFGMMGKHFGRFFGSMLLITVLYFMLMMGLWFFITVMLNFSSSMQNVNPFSKEVLGFYVQLNFVLWPLFLLAGGYFYMLNGIVLHEKQTGSGLLKRIHEIGFRKEVYGVETE